MATSSVKKGAEKIQSIKEGLSYMRAHKRRTVVWPATFYVANFEFSSTLYVISLSGIRIKLPLPLANGTEASVKIRNKVHLKARVVWHAGEFLGLQFIDDADEVRDALGDMATGLY